MISVFFVGQLRPLFWTYDDIPRLHTSSPVYNRFLKFTSGATPADLQVANMAAEPFQFMYLHTSIAAAWVRDQACRYLALCIKNTLYRMRYVALQLSWSVNVCWNILTSTASCEVHLWLPMHALVSRKKLKHKILGGCDSRIFMVYFPACRFLSTL